jgi:hypothetical protein
MAQTPRRQFRSEREALTEMDAVLDRNAVASFPEADSSDVAQAEQEHATRWTLANCLRALKDGDALPGDPPNLPIKDQADMNSAGKLTGDSAIGEGAVIAFLEPMAKKHGLTLPASLVS